MTKSDKIIHCTICGFKRFGRMFDIHFKEYFESLQNLKKACNLCGKKYRGNYELNLHVKRNHENVLLHCNQCSKKFKSENGLRYHMNKLQSVSTEFHVVSDACEKGFMNVQQLQDHQRITHSAKRLKCDMFNDEFLYYSSFCRHTRRENCNKKLLPQESMILCKDYLKCRKKFKTSRTAKAHHNTFHETKEYDCERCGKVFKYRSSKYYHKKRCSVEILGN